MGKHCPSLRMTRKLHGGRRFGRKGDGMSAYVQHQFHYREVAVETTVLINGPEALLCCGERVVERDMVRWCEMVDSTVTRAYVHTSQKNRWRWQKLTRK